MERLFLQLLKKKLTSLDKCPPLNNHRTLNPPSPPPPPPPTKISEKISPTNMSCLKTWFHKVGDFVKETMRDKIYPPLYP